jgi:hypothetical protein
MTEQVGKPESLRLEMRGVRRSFGATKARRGGELTVAPGAFWTTVASEARHRFLDGRVRKFDHVTPCESAVAAALCRRSPKKLGQNLLKVGGSCG